MTRQEYEKKMKEHHTAFQHLWSKMVNDTNDYVKDNPITDMMFLKGVENFCDEMALSGPWILDRIHDRGMRDKKSLTVKVRKALGFTQ